MRLSGLAAAGVLAVWAPLAGAAGSPPVTTSIEASWPAADLVTQYLETISLEAPNSFFPALDYLVFNPHSHRARKYSNVRPAALDTAKEYAAQGVNPVFAPEGELWGNETLALLDASLARSALFLRERGLFDSLHLSLANREASVRIEGIRLIWEDRLAQITALSANADALLTGSTDGDESTRAEAVSGSSAVTCESWIDVGGKMACSEDDFWIIVGEEQRAAKVPVVLPGDLPLPERPELLPSDHISPSGAYPHLPRVVLYGSPVSPAFPRLYAFLRELSWPREQKTVDPQTRQPSGSYRPHPPRLQFALRWKPSALARQMRRKLVLSGYGAALDIKKSDYLAIDDRISSGGSSKPAPAADTDATAVRMEPVRKRDIGDLSVRAAQLVLSADDPFDAFVNITAAFPRLASQLATLVPTPNPRLVDEVSTNQITAAVSRGPAFFLNGKLLSEADVEPFALLRLMRAERKILNDLIDLHRSMTSGVARHLLIAGGPQPPKVSRDRIDPELLGELYDATDREEGGDVILWWNDLEKDRRYKTWDSSVREYLRPSFPGSLTQVARNLHNLVFLLDLSQPASIAHITLNIRQYISRGVPIRFGVVPVVGHFGDSSVSTLMAQMLWYLTDTAGRASTISFLDDVAQEARGSRISEDLLEGAYDRLRTTVSSSDGEALAPFSRLRQYGIGGKGRNSRDRLAKARDYLDRLGVAAESENKDDYQGAVFLNGAYFPLDDDFAQTLQRTLSLHTQFLAQEVYMRSLNDEDDAANFFADLPHTHDRRNPYIFPSVETNPLKVLNLVDALEGADPSWLFESFIASSDPNATVDHELEATPAEASLIVVGDFDRLSGVQLAWNALRLAETTPRIRVLFLHNPEASARETHAWSLSRLLWHLIESKAVHEVMPSDLLAWIELGIDRKGPESGAGDDWSDANVLKEVLKHGITDRGAGEAALYWDLLQLPRQRLGFAAGEAGIVINGRVVGPLPAEHFNLADFETLLDLELEKRIKPLVEAVKASSLSVDGPEGSHASHFYMLAGSIVGAAHAADPGMGVFATTSNERTADYQQLLSKHSAILGQAASSALFEIVAVVDPASELAQKWAPILRTLNKMDSTTVSIHLNPTLGLTEVPIKRFYDFSFEHALQFDAVGTELAPRIRFESIPPDVLVTYAADTQRSWLAFPKSGEHDLDNIKLADLPVAHKSRGVEAVLELEALIVEGHARDMPSARPPRGLQLELSRVATLTDHTTSASIVMANLGYVQFKAGPGRWRLGIREGRSSEVFELESAGAAGWKSGDVGATGTSFSVSTLEGKTLYPRFRRKPGHESTELLTDLAAPSASAKAHKGGLWDSLKAMLPFLAPKPGDLVSLGKRAEINVFTVASGHLYERMSFLMMISVMRHTKSSVKFWFIQNFLSPSFKAFIPHLAQEYGFDYELVTYKWPHWLRGQKEKQRTIWGYKILFLDVLFPLELDRIIFVDSDQIVRADLKELVDLDLEGAPYAYAPMGGYDGEKPEMEGFRFWKTGYWSKHLRGRPYHISALYVVDLDRFRQVAAGDLLRQQYQALSADPGSLANLDQDLPNNMNPNLPIYTLPKEWLWCETWCADEALATAKTIDLCNNPRTHEPKLQRAKRLIPEWTVYDDEVAALAKRVAEAQDGDGAFKDRADALEQAIQQQEERNAFVGEDVVPADARERGSDLEHIKDEL